MATDNILFQDIFDIKDLDPQGKKFDRVSRLVGRSENYEMDLTLDFNAEIYPCSVGDKFSLVLASSLSLEASTSTSGVEKKESWRERAPGERDLSDEYEYVMFGKVYKYEDSNKGTAGQQVSVYISYGGLLMCLEGDYRHLQNLTVGENIYLLLRK
ncbi:RNA polymerase [Parasitella parasitica]|nr:RNA polymerase [Parasitella parasitica]